MMGVHDGWMDDKTNLLNLCQTHIPWVATDTSLDYKPDRPPPSAAHRIRFPILERFNQTPKARVSHSNTQKTQGLARVSQNPG